VFFRVVDRHRFDSEPVLIRISILMPKSGSKFGSEAGLASKRCQSTNSHADTVPSFTHVGIKYREQKKNYFIHSNSSLQCFSFLISGKGVMIFLNYFVQHFEIIWEK
jgi:hypothetical protein